MAIERGDGSLPESDETVALPAIVLAELLVGVRMADTAERAASRQRKVQSLLDRGAVVPFDQFMQSGGPTSSASFGVWVGPGDEAHFRRIPALRVEVLGNG